MVNLARRMYETANQLGTGTGPFVEVMDAKWSGSLECSVPLVAIAILHTPAACYWVKSNPAALNPPISASLHARADYKERASFAISVHGGFLPSVQVSCGEDLTAACTFGSKSAIAGRAHLLAEAECVAFIVVILQGSVVKVGRNRLWHLRSKLASSLPIGFMWVN